MRNWASSGLDAFKRQLPGLDPAELEDPFRMALSKATSEDSIRRLRAAVKELEAQRKLNSKEKLDTK